MLCPRIADKEVSLITLKPVRLYKKYQVDVVNLLILFGEIGPMTRKKTKR
jgi:hypothetical protein